MKKVTVLLLIIASVLFMACSSDDGGKTTPSSDTSPEQAASQIDADEQENEIENLAVCLWPKVGLRSKAGRGKDAEYITTMYFGETVTLTGRDKRKG